VIASPGQHGGPPSQEWPLTLIVGQIGQSAICSAKHGKDFHGIFTGTVRIGTLLASPL